MIDRDAVIAAAASRLAHHEAGHAVAAVARGGYLVEIFLGEVDWTTDGGDDVPGHTRHQTKPVNAPFVTYAGPWATAKWTVENDPDVDDFDNALEYAWDDAADGDALKYGGAVDQLNEFAQQLGLGWVGAAWEADWHWELEELWPVICEIAALLLRGETVTHDDVMTSIGKHVPPD